MSKRHMLGVGFALSCVAPYVVVAQVPAEVQEAMRARDRAELTFDPTTWDRLTADDFTIVLADGTLMTKAERLAQLKTRGATTVLPVIYIDGQVVSEGAIFEHPFALPDVQIKRYTDVQIKRHGDALVRRFRHGSTWVVEIWLRDSSGWRVHAAQVTSAKQ